MGWRIRRSYRLGKHTRLPWLLRATYPGSPGAAAPGQQTQAVVDLDPGAYVAFAADENRPYGNDPHRRMAGFAVAAPPGTGTGTLTIPTPSADGSVTLADNTIALPRAISPGRHVWRFSNTGQPTHEVRLLKAPRPVTVAQVLAAVNAGNPAQPPPPGGLDFRALVALPVAGGMSWLSPGHAAWAAIDAAGRIDITEMANPAGGGPGTGRLVRFAPNTR